MSATSPACAGPPWAVAAVAAPSGACSVNDPLPSLPGTSSMIRTPSFLATSTAAEVLPRSTTSARAFRSDR